MHHKHLVCLLVLTGGFGVSLSAQTLDGSATSVRSLVEVRVTGPAQLQQLLSLDLDLAGCRRPLLGQRRVEVIARPGDLQLLSQANLKYMVRIADMEVAHAAAVAQHGVSSTDTLTPAIGQGSMGGHYTLAEMESILDDFHSQYPNLCSPRVSIGQSIEGRDLWMVKISDNVVVDETEPEVYYDALHHAREPLSLSTTLLFMDELLDGYGNDPEATFLINERELYFVPCVNPDGYEFNYANNPNGGGLWRKNRRNNGNGTFGVDLNRNYATFWNAPNGGSSSNTGSETYRGSSPFSEPETAAVEAFSASRQFVQVFSSHSYTDVLLRPWAYQAADPSNVAAYNVLGAFMVQDSGINHGRWGSLLYISSGTSVDHHHASRGSFSWTAELGRANEGGFWPVGPTIEVIARRHQRMFRKAALTAGAAFRLDSVEVAEAANSNGNLVVEPGETGEVVVMIENVGMAQAPLLVELIAVSPTLVVGTNVISSGGVAAFGSLVNSSMPLTFSVPTSFSSSVAQMLLRISGDGRTQELPLDVLLVPMRTCVEDDFEQDFGFSRAAVGTATTGLWERAAPSQTTSGGVTLQPGTQTTPGGSFCWVTDGRPGASVGSFDVDSGYTDLLSPVMDLSHVRAASITVDLFYGESVGNDALLVELSRDGGSSWGPLYSRNVSTGSWLSLDLPLSAPFTAEMVVRVRAQDFAPSLVEASIDGFQVKAAVDDGAVTLFGSGKLGTNMRVGMNSSFGTLLLPIGALGRGPGLTAPGVLGTMLLDPSTVALFPLQAMTTDDYASIDLALPVQAGLIGVDLSFQTVLVANGSFAFGSNAPVVTLN